MLLAVLNKPWKQHTSKQQFYGYSISQTIKTKWAVGVFYNLSRLGNEYSFEEAQEATPHQTAAVGLLTFYFKKPSK